MPTWGAGWVFFVCVCVCICFFSFSLLIIFKVLVKHVILGSLMHIIVELLKFSSVVVKV